MRRMSCFQKLFLTVFVFALMAGPAEVTMTDDDLLKLFEKGSVQQVVDAIKGDAKRYAPSWYAPLMWAAEKNPNPEVITSLIKMGAEINAQDNEGNTPFMYAAWYNLKPHDNTSPRQSRRGGQCAES